MKLPLELLILSSLVQDCKVHDIIFKRISNKNKNTNISKDRHFVSVIYD